MQFLRNITTSRLISSFFTPRVIATTTGQISTRGISGLVTNSCQQLLQQPHFNSILMNFTRTIIRIHFPRPKEHMRIRKHGWKKRMSTESGRKIIMKRILKGKHNLTH